VGVVTPPNVGKAIGLPPVVGKDKGVMEGVTDAGGTRAVWVWKKLAITVATPAVSEALMSGVGDPGTSPPHDAISIPTTSKSNMFFPASFIFTSLKVFWIFLPTF
jgi:hypothetical protein